MVYFFTTTMDKSTYFSGKIRFQIGIELKFIVGKLHLIKNRLQRNIT